jgi:hypothetical protein
MSVHITRLRLPRLAVCATLAVFAASACEQRAPITGPDTFASDGVSDARTSQAPDTTPAAVNAQLAQLRQLTAHYRDLDAAMAAGYNVQVTPCLELPGVGAMGFHYGNPAFIDDPAANALQPELLLYEPQKNGKLRFVGVEYIIPFALLPPTATPPTVLGQSMHQNVEAGLWALHAWVGRENPTGIFEDWNPKVSCEFAP